MNNIENLAALARRLTNLSEEDISILVDHSKSMRALSELGGGDVFIDIVAQDTNLAVVAAQYCSDPGSINKIDQVGETMLRHNEPGIYRTLELGIPSREFKALVWNGTILVRQSSSPLFNGEKVIGVLILEKEISSDTISENMDASSSKQRIQKEATFDEVNRIAGFMQDALIQFDGKGNAVYANPRAVQLYKSLGYQDDILTLSFEKLSFGPYTLEDIFSRKRVDQNDIAIGDFILDVTYASVQEEENLQGVIIIVRDSTSESRQKRELVLKSAAIDEIHHRVKNNLQTIVSLISLEARRSPVVEVKRLAQVITSRIQSISLTHEILAQHGVDTLELNEMLTRLVNSSESYTSTDELELSISVVGDAMYIESEIATTVALVVNELLQNSINHAFIGMAQGTILLHIQKGARYSSISVVDNGIGIREAAKPSSLGYKLIHRLVYDKLKGKLDVRTSAEGTIAQFTFANNSENL